MIEMPIRLNVVSEPPDEKIFGSTMSTAATIDPDAVEFQAIAGAGKRRRDGLGGRVGHVSRVPRRPIGLKIRISTSKR